MRTHARRLKILSTSSYLSTYFELLIEAHFGSGFAGFVDRVDDARDFQCFGSGRKNRLVVDDRIDERSDLRVVRAAAGEVAAGEVAAGEVAAGEVAAGEVAVDEVAVAVAAGTP